MPTTPTELTPPFDHRALVARLYRILGWIVGGTAAVSLFVFGLAAIVSLFVPDVPPIPDNAGFLGSIFYVLVHLPWYMFHGLAWVFRELGLHLAPWFLGTMAIGYGIYRTGAGIAYGTRWARIVAGLIALMFVAVAVSIVADSPHDQDAWITAAIIFAIPLYPLWVLGLRYSGSSPARSAGEGTTPRSGVVDGL